MHYRCDNCGCYLDEDGRTCDECQSRESASRTRRAQTAILVDSPQCEFNFTGGKYDERDYVTGEAGCW